MRVRPDAATLKKGNFIGAVAISHDGPRDGARLAEKWKTGAVASCVQIARIERTQKRPMSSGPPRDHCENIDLGKSRAEQSANNDGRDSL